MDALNSPTRIIWAIPRASFRSVLLMRAESAACICRVCARMFCFYKADQVGCGLVLELVRRLDHHIGRAGDEVVCLQQAVDQNLRDKILSLIGEPHGQLSRRQFRKFQRQVDDLAADVIRDTSPDPIRSRAVICQCLDAARAEAIVPPNGMDGSPSTIQAESLKEEGELQ